MNEGAQGRPVLVGEGTDVLEGEDNGVLNVIFSNRAPSLGVDDVAGPFLSGVDNGVAGVEKKEASSRGPWLNEESRHGPRLVGDGGGLSSASWSLSVCQATQTSFHLVRASVYDWAFVGYFMFDSGRMISLSIY